MSNKTRLKELKTPHYKCPQCGYRSPLKWLVEKHYDIWHVKRVLRELLIDNPCIACAARHKEIRELSFDDKIKLCLCHREIYDKWLVTERRKR